MPLWVLLFLLTSPLAKSTSPAHKSSLLVDLWDITVMPLSVFLTIMLPTIAMYLDPSTVSAKDHYTALAFWQLFPIWHYLAHTILSTVGRTLVGPVDGTTQGVVTHSAYLSRVRGLYDLVFLGGVMGQLPVLLLALAPDNVLSSAAESFPWMKPYVTAGVTLSSVYVPLSPFNYPTVDAKSIGSGDLAPLAVHFLHWDLYIGAGSLCLWALYVHRTTVKKTSLAVLLAKTALWFSLGGFASAVAALLWERDVQVLESDYDIKKA
ncbi:hypothetical protein PFICI_13360 [Pestalotiopsis fici W106-1]|uniref:Uncharacterized protein n=1 Tax=Pestalotiopsis fici (strain W106-1 / CGMCC3.15140) TaxID=1229662 RepID=W3WPY1_PESFW|nr:uncharacterized protein PFICI_13360 [Pestalotiopsis fici W106-1]ETS74876.1 hypothetical protein PFICI_13360 [Pestalotiopsis fici W106-1]